MIFDVVADSLSNTLCVTRRTATISRLSANTHVARRQWRKGQDYAALWILMQICHYNFERYAASRMTRKPNFTYHAMDSGYMAI